ncbi:hypothetical protein MTsPCn9_15480 [Croceitalea sp. MTPC9]|uniref:hypothetical protein n=1 Tax=unclassified Croceitalea TaxID=2632280 RepID=UPI002B39AA31|nr:hypothetical protein MTsPCn6_13650 [Croceitalea sp. MTPC6]GMN16612.1 hypothetical protein MTsPCn9_15480 [Croceitalea sp. MTPC9]
MIKFFRKIRQKLLQESRFSKYLVYALGEIILVMIGILLALQINNWNEARKNNLNEQKLVEKMIGQTRVDSALFAQRIQGSVMTSTIFDNYLTIINQGASDSIKEIKYIGELSPVFKFNNGSNLIRNHSQDFKQINNLELREELMEYAYLVTMMDGAIELTNTNIQEFLVPLELEYYEDLKPYDSTSTLYEMKAVFQNPKMESRFGLLKGLSLNIKEQVETLQTKNQSVLKDLKRYKLELDN